MLNDAERSLLDEAATSAGKPTSTWARDTLLQIAAFTVAQQKAGGAATKKKAAGRPVKKPKA